ncbi:MAG TPA: M3 family metallopeptidase [Hyphomicrobiales bacterium]|nr:M3 family metallopeptidase [Hyphomicrobiales bacterium]
MDQPVNPLLAAWDAPFGLPPFAAIAPEDFPAAFAAALAEHEREVEAIAANPAPPDFANTIAALELSGRDLSRIASLFFVVAGADTSDAIEAIERDMAPALARHRSAIYLNEKLFRRVDDLHRRIDGLGLDDEARQVLARYYTIFVRAGAAAGAATRKRLAAISERLAALGTQFGQNVLADERGFTLVLDGEDDLAGLPRALRDAAARAATDRGLAGKYVVTLARSSIEPFLQFSARRDLREKAFAAWSSRGGGGGETDNRAIIAEMVALRAERARLLGYPSFAHFRLADAMAKTPEAALDLLNRVWTPGRAQALREQAALQQLAEAEGLNAPLAPWDWRYFAEKRRTAEFAFDEGAVKPYLQLDRLIEAAFDVAGRLFGLVFTPRPDLTLYHPDARAWEVTGQDGRAVGLFVGDYFARPSKHSGAWMTALRSQEKLAGDIRPIILNVANFAKPPEGEPALLGLDDARTLFHEFGHALHGLLSDVTYPLIAGTSVARDFVEFPSQLYEHWIERPEVLGRFARHYRTGEPMPDALLRAMLKARRFNQGFATAEYVAAALIDLDFHLLQDADGLDAGAFERAALARIGMPAAITLRHRPTHFAHVFAGEGYAAGYYSYLWSEVLDADGFGAFEEAGDVFDPATARRLHDFVYSAGWRQDPAAAYRAFRGRDPEVAALLAKRGLEEVNSE